MELTESTIALVIIIVVVVCFKVGMGPISIIKSTVKKSSIKRNQTVIINKMFHAAREHGELWRVDIFNDGFIVRDKKENSHMYRYKDLGYGNLGDAKNCGFTGNWMPEIAFNVKLHRTAMLRGAIYYETFTEEVRGGGASPTSFTTYDGGHSYTADSNVSVRDVYRDRAIISKEYAKKYCLLQYRKKEKSNIRNI